MNVESILAQGKIVDSSIHRVTTLLEVGFNDKTTKEVVLYELIKSYHQIENMVRELAPERFGAVERPSIAYPELSVEQLYVCPHCGNPDCGSDHK